MQNLNCLVECPVYDSFRVQQVAGSFDLTLADKLNRSFIVELPGLDEEWRIGCIVGPSGSGKTTVARKAYGPAFDASRKWAKDRAVIDGFGERSVKEISAALTAVGFSSPPAWCKPYHVLSNGEQFRCGLARALLSDKSLVVYDEFTSVVDRTVAKIGSAAVSKAVRRKDAQRFVAVTCHYDIVDWMEPDWVLDMASGELARGRLRRPNIAIDVFRCENEAWRMFAPHHYLSASLHRACNCYLGVMDGVPVAFAALIRAFGHGNMLRVSRIVVLPDFQGVGIGRAMLRVVAASIAPRRLRLVTSHTGMIRALERCDEWRATSIYRHGTNNHGGWIKGRSQSHGRCVVSWEYVGNGSESEKAKGKVGEGSLEVLDDTPASDQSGESARRDRSSRSQTAGEARRKTKRHLPQRPGTRCER